LSVITRPLTEKRCNRCGKDLDGQVRWRDQSGYWCAPCNHKAKSEYCASHLPCDDCGCDVKRGQEWKLDDRRLCECCWQKRKAEAARRELEQEDARKCELQERARRRRNRTVLIILVELALGLPVLGWLLHGSAVPADAVEPTTQAVR
jgi:hypothetical protein